MPVVAIVRDGVTIRWDGSSANPIRPGDRLVHVSHTKG